MAFDHIPALPALPHDPLSLLLDARIGFHVLSSTDVELGGDGALRLRPSPASLPALANAAGTLGNLVLPSNAAFAPDGTLLLLDRDAGSLLRFDRCACAFVRVPGFGVGSSERNWRAPSALGVSCGSLFVCDPGSKRVLVFALDNLGLRSSLRPPRGPHPDWDPVAIAFDARGRTFVADGAFGFIHRFDRRGRWEKAFPGFNLPSALACDEQDRLFVTVTGTSGLELVALDTEGQRLAVGSEGSRLSASFRRLPFEVDDVGRLNLGSWCVDTGECALPPGSGWFDSHGQPLPVAPPTLPVVYVPNGSVVLGPLDSGLAGCVWHRLIPNAKLSADSQLVISTFTAEQPLTLEQLTLIAQWATNLELNDSCEDGLVRSEPGRYLWLKLSFESSGPTSAALSALEIEFPRIGSDRYLPAVFRAEPTSADFSARFVALFDVTLRSIERQIDLQARLFDPASAPATRVDGAQTDFLSWLGTWVGVTLDRRWDEARRRRFLKAAGALFDCRGTLAGLRRQLELLLGLDDLQASCPGRGLVRSCQPRPLNCAPPPKCVPPPRPSLILEHFRLRRWLHVGRGRLGAESVLWSSKIVGRAELDAGSQVDASRMIESQDPLRDPFHVYAHRFSVFLPARYRESARERRALEALIESESPAHTRHQLVFVEPRFRIGVQAMLGFDSVVAGLPRHARLGEARLDASVRIAGRGGAAAQFAVGRSGRVGATTRVG